VFAISEVETRTWRIVVEVLNGERNEASLKKNPAPPTPRIAAEGLDSRGGRVPEEDRSVANGSTVSKSPASTILPSEVDLMEDTAAEEDGKERI